MNTRTKRRLQQIVTDLAAKGGVVSADTVLEAAYARRVLKRRDPEVVRAAHLRRVQRAIADMTEQGTQLRMFLSPPGQPRVFVQRTAFLTPGPLRDRKAEAALRHCLSELQQIEPSDRDWFAAQVTSIADALRRRTLRRAA